MPGPIGEFAPRAVCSDVERRAAVWAHDELRARGHEAWMETHWVRPQRALALALGCALTVIGGLVAVAAPVPGLVVAAIGALCVVVDVAGLRGPLRLLMPRRATQVVLVAPDERAGWSAAADEGPPVAADVRGGGAAAGDEGRPVAADVRGGGAAAGDEGRPVAADKRSGWPPAGDEGGAVELLLVARTDVPRCGIAARRLAGVPGALWWVAGAAVAVAAAAGVRVAGAEGTLLGVAQLVPTVVLLVAVALAADACFAAVGDGAAEDAALAAAIELHDGLVRHPPPGLRPGLLLAGPEALRAHLRRERLDPRRTALLHVRAGDVRSRHPQWLAAAEAAGLPARKRGPRGLAAALAPPEHAEELARALRPAPAPRSSPAPRDSPASPG